jgi:integrase
VTQRRRAVGSGGNTKGRKAAFGSIRVLPSGRVQARYTGPDGLTHHAPTTFQTKTDARAWLALAQAEIIGGKWKPRSADSAVTFGRYAATWVADRPLKPRTRYHYQQLLRQRLLPRFGPLRPAQISRDMVRAWYAEMGSSTPTLRAHCYSLLRAILATAVDDQLISANPCHIRGAGNSKRVHKIEPATLAELELILANMPEKHRLLVLLAAWCGLRFGELAELRRSDVDLRNGRLKVRRGVVYVPGAGRTVGTPKSDAGIRDVAIPPHLLPIVKAHLADFAQFGRDGLLFPAKDGSSHLAESSVLGRAPRGKRPGWGFYAARVAAKRPDLRFHDLRHTGATLAAQNGATLAELMSRIGHSTPSAALRYQHAAQGRDAEIARRLSAMAEAGQ